MGGPRWGTATWGAFTWTAALAGPGTTFFLDSGDDEIAELDPSGTVTRRYVPGPAIDEPIAMVTAATGAREYIHANHQGSIAATSDDTGALAEGPLTYDAYGACYAGATNAPCATSGIPYRFTGRRLDPETGLYYYRARYYDPTIGRFLQTDPVGYGDDLDWYSYVGNDPANKTDSSGTAANTCSLIGAQSCSGNYPGSGTGLGDDARRPLGQRVAANDSPTEPDAEGEVGSSYREFESNREREIERENDEIDGPAHSPGADYPEDDTDVYATTDPETFNTVIGRLKDIKDLEPGEQSLLGRLPYRGNSRANWQQNSGILRQVMARGKPIRDASPGDTGGPFLQAERNLLRSHGWIFDPQTNYWNPPK